MTSEQQALHDAEHALACIAAVTPEDSDVGRYARNYFRTQSKVLPDKTVLCPTCKCPAATRLEF